MSLYRINEATFLGILWLCVGLSLLFVVTRIFLQIKVEQKWHIADAFVLIAWILSLGNTAVWSTVYKQMYLIIKFSKGGMTTVPPDLVSSGVRYLRAQLAGYFLSYISLWCVKMSFLFFLRKLGEKYRPQRILWWSVFVFVIISIGPVLGTLDYRCGLSSAEDSIANCMSEHAIWFERVSLNIATSMDMVTDGAIIILSGNIMWRVKITGRRKFALVGISLLTSFIMAVALVRLLLSVNGSRILDPAWGIFWNAIEICVAINVACLASFWTIYTKWRRQNKNPYVKDNASMEVPMLIRSAASANEELRPPTPCVERQRSSA